MPAMFTEFFVDKSSSYGRIGKVKSKDQTINHLTSLIQKEVGFFNRWYVGQRTEKEACEKAAKKIYKYLNKKFGPFDYSEYDFTQEIRKINQSYK